MKTIFVSIASYRDTYCSRTLESLYENAKHPANIYVGICVQNKESEEECVLTNPKLQKYNNNIQTIRLKHFEAKGPTHARYLCATLFDDQDYFFQIDSHTLFEKNWDEIIIKMVDEIKKNTDSKDVVISHYPPNYEDIDNADRNVHDVAVICETFFSEDEKMISFMGAGTVNMKTHDGYIKSPHIAAGMFFCEGKCIKDVPFDPNLPNLFIGEEILHSARVWTAGYDIYSPTQNIVYHLYTREDQPKVWENKTFNSTNAQNRVRKIMGFDGATDYPEYLNDNSDKYGFGSKRTLEEFYEYAGIDIKNKKVTKNFCPKAPEKEGFSVMIPQSWNWDTIAMVFIVIIGLMIFIFKKNVRRLWKLRPRWLN
jgi:hypothetical protein